MMPKIQVNNTIADIANSTNPSPRSLAAPFQNADTFDLSFNISECLIALLTCSHSCASTKCHRRGNARVWEHGAVTYRCIYLNILDDIHTSALRSSRAARNSGRTVRTLAAIGR